jgi:hypothetical protein
VGRGVELPLREQQVSAGQGGLGVLAGHRSLRCGPFGSDEPERSPPDT